MTGKNLQICVLCLDYMFAHPGKKLHFMGMEFGQWNEWNYESSLDWHLLDLDNHKGLQFFIKDLNSVYKRFPAFMKMIFIGKDLNGLMQTIHKIQF